MFKELRRKWREAVDAFQAELDLGQASGNARDLIGRMEAEAAEAKVLLAKLKKDLEEAQRRASNEETEARTCRRREAMAREIKDEETAEIAGRYATKHEERHAVLSRKAAAIKEEVSLTEADVQGMLSQIKEARARQPELKAQAGRAKARNRMSSSDELFEEFDRAAQRVDSMGDGGGGEELDNLETEYASRDLDERIRELKERMRE